MRRPRTQAPWHPGTLLRLLHLCDSLFPLGGFAYSDGLETAASTGDVRDATSLGEWVDVVVSDTFGRFEGPAVWRTWSLIADNNWNSLAELDAEMTAMRPSSTGRQSTRSMGHRLFNTWCALYPDPTLEAIEMLREERDVVPTLPVAFAAACRTAGATRIQTAEAFAYTRLASTVSAAMRVAPIGQRDAHALLARALDRVPALVEVIGAAEKAPMAFAPAFDIATMSQQYLHSRLFRS